MHKRAVAAARRAVWDAHDRAKLHHGLVKRPGTVGRDDRSRLRPHVPLNLGIVDRPLVSGQARDDAQDVAVHGRFRDAESDGRDRARRVVADTRQAAQRRVVGRHLPAVGLAHDLRGAVQVAHPAVIAQSLPQLEIDLLRHLGQRAHIRAGRQKPLIIRDDRLHPRLLEHDLGQPDAVRVAGAPPRQVAVPGIVPGEQRLYDRARHRKTAALSPI